MSTTINGTTGITFPDASTLNTAPSGFGFKNRIINGAMMIDQRNGGASFTPFGANMVDRWFFNLSQTSKFTGQQNQGAVTPPSAFTNYLGVTSSSAYSVLSSDYFSITQKIEGYSIADLAWGTAGAKAVTLSFYVYSSLTGTFGGSITSGSGSYPFSYAVSSANTWTYVSVTIPANTSYVPTSTTNGIGIQVNFGLGCGSTYSGAVGAWASGFLLTATGATSVVGTSGATFYITGVQLEKGSTATSFDYRPYGTELALCQRYFVKYTYANGNPVTSFANWDSVNLFGEIYLPVIPRATPSFSYGSAAGDFSTFQANTVKTVTAIGSNLSATQTQELSFSVASGYTGGQAGFVRTQTANGWLSFSAEL